MKMEGKGWKVAAALLLAVALSGCAADKNDQSADRDDDVMPFGVSNNDRDRGLGDGRINRWDNERNNAAATSPHNNTRMDIDDKIAETVAKMEGIDSAYVMMTDRNVYVAVKLEDAARQHALHTNRYGAGNESDVDDEVKARIAAKVQELAPDVKNVFVSANPDFVDRMRGYRDRFQAGQPIRGAILEFNRAVERIFPEKIDVERNVR